MRHFRVTLLIVALAFLTYDGLALAADPAKQLAVKPPRALRIGAVAYGPDAVVIWRGMRWYFDRQGMPIDFVLYSHYDALVQACGTVR